MSRYQIFIECWAMLEVWFCCKFQCFLSVIFHVFSEDKLFINLEKSFSKSFFAFARSFYVELAVAPKPRLFLKTYTPMNLFNSQTEIEILFQCLMMSSVSLFITQIWNQFFYAIKNKSLRSKWIIFLKIV